MNLSKKHSNTQLVKLMQRWLTMAKHVSRGKDMTEAALCRGYDVAFLVKSHKLFTPDVYFVQSLGETPLQFH